MQMWVILLAALVSFGIASFAGKMLIPLLYRLRFIREDRGAADASGKNIPIGGGALLDMGAFAACALGYIIMRYTSPQLSAESDILLFTAGQAAVLTASAAGFYLDRLTSMGKKVSEKTGIAVYAVMSAAYLLAVFMKNGIGEHCVIGIPFYGEIKCGVWYYPVMLVLMVLTAHIAGSEGTESAASAVGSAVFSAVGIYILCTLKSYEESIFFSAVSGAYIGFLVWGFPPEKTFLGKTGKYFSGMTAALLTVKTNRPVIIFIMLLPFLIEKISETVLSGMGKTAPLSRYLSEKGKAFTVMLFFAASALSSVTGALAFMKGGQ